MTIQKRSEQIDDVRESIPTLAPPTVVLVIPNMEPERNEGPFYVGSDIAEYLASEMVKSTPTAIQSGITELRLRGTGAISDPARLAPVLDITGQCDLTGSIERLDPKCFCAEESKKAVNTIKEVTGELTKVDNNWQNASDESLENKEVTQVLSQLDVAVESNYVLSKLIRDSYLRNTLTLSQLKTALAIIDICESTNPTNLIVAAGQYHKQLTAEYIGKAQAIGKEIGAERLASLMAVYAVSANARGTLNSAMIIRVPMSVSEALQQPEVIMDPIKNSELESFSILLPVPVTSLGRINGLLEATDNSGKAVSIWVTPRTANPKDLIAMGRENPPTADLLGARQSVWAGAMTCNGIPVISAASALGVRTFLDTQFDAESNLYGMSQPMFGLYKAEKKSLRGADEGSLTTQYWAEEYAATLAEYGINVFWKDRQSITPYKARTRTTIEGLEQLWAARLSDVIGTFFLNSLRSVTGSVSEIENEAIVKRLVNEGLGQYSDCPHFRVTYKPLLTKTTREMRLKLDIGIVEAVEHIKMIRSISRIINLSASNK